MQTVTVARNEICPLLDALISELEASGCATQQAFFTRIRGQLHHAQDPFALSDTIMGLSSSEALGWDLPDTADVLMCRILEKTAELVRALEGAPPNVH